MIYSTRNAKIIIQLEFGVILYVTFWSKPTPVVSISVAERCDGFTNNNIFWWTANCAKFKSFNWHSGVIFVCTLFVLVCEAYAFVNTVQQCTLAEPRDLTPGNCDFTTDIIMHTRSTAGSGNAFVLNYSMDSIYIMLQYLRQNLHSMSVIK